jgi:hypothetical protein
MLPHFVWAIWPQDQAYTGPAYPIQSQLGEPSKRVPEAFKEEWALEDSNFGCPPCFVQVVLGPWQTRIPTIAILQCDLRPEKRCQPSGRPGGLRVEGEEEEKQGIPASQEMPAGQHQEFLSSRASYGRCPQPGDLTPQTFRDSPLFQIGCSIVPWNGKQWQQWQPFSIQTSIHLTMFTEHPLGAGTRPGTRHGGSSGSQ